MRLHIFYASTFVLCLSLFLLSNENIRPSTLNIYEATATISAIILALAIIGKQYVLHTLKAVWRFLSDLPLPSWMTIGVSVLIILACASVAYICDIIGAKYSSNDWIELPIRGGGLGICILIAGYIIIAKTCKVIDQKFT